MTAFRCLSSTTLLGVSALLLLAPGCATQTAQAPAPYSRLVSLQYAGSQDAVASLRKAIADAGADRARLDAIEADLAGMLERADTTFAGRQAICENLGTLYAVSFARGDHPIPPVLVAMLTDPKQVDFARSALERAPGAAVDAVFLSSLGTSKGRVRMALIESVGVRRIAAGVPALGDILSGGDPAEAAAAARALGKIGSKEALEALEKARDPLSTEVVEARIRCARNLPPAESRRLLRDLCSDTAVATPFRVSAFLALLSLEPDTAAEQITAALGGGDPALKEAVVTSLVGLPQDEVVPIIVSHFDSWDPQTQLGAIDAIGRIDDPRALPVVLAAAHSDREELRRAALAALGGLPGTRDIALLLAGAAKAPGETGNAARQSLSRLIGPGVDEAVYRGATRSGDPLRVVLLEELALRNMPGAWEILMGTRSDPAVPVRCAALDGLALVAPPSLEPTLLGWLTEATDPTEQSHAVRAAAGAAARNPDAKARLQPVADIFGKVPGAAQAHLLTVLARVGGADGAGYVLAVAQHGEARLAQSAVAALASWSDSSALGPLATLAARAPNESLRRGAFDGAVQAMQQNSGWLNAEQKAIVARLRKASLDAEQSRRLDVLEKGPGK